MWYIFAHIPYTIFIALCSGPARSFSVFHTEKPAFQYETLKKSHIGMQEVHDFYSQIPHYYIILPSLTACLAGWAVLCTVYHGPTLVP